MPYPEEIITELTEKHGLLPDLQQQLHDSLMVEELHSAIEAGTFNPNDLLIPLENEVVYIPTSNVIGHILKNRSSLTELKEHASSNSVAMKEYLKIRKEIIRLHSLRLKDPVERTERKILLRTISIELEALYDFIIANPILRLEIFNLSKILSLHLNSELKWLENLAKVYFQQVFNNEGEKITEISFFSKLDGVQMGRRMRINYSDAHESEHQIFYYIKTHQYGSLRAGGSTVVPVDPKELFVYKVLEYTGFGPKAHFFFNPLSPGAFFIATQDESFTKVSGKEKFFKTYGQVQDDSKGLLLKTEINDESKKGVARIDILLRIFNLWDIITNSGNYGLTTVNQEREKWRIIDFRVVSQDDYSLERIFEDFVEGTGMEGYLGLPSSVLKEAEQAERIRLAALLIEEFTFGRPCQSHEGRKMCLADATARAYTEIKEYITKHHEVLQIDLSRVLTDLERYFLDIQRNLSTFIEGFTCHTKQAALLEETTVEQRIRHPAA